MTLLLPDPIEMSYEGSRSGLAFPWGQIVSAPRLGDTSRGGADGFTHILRPHPAPCLAPLAHSMILPEDLFPAGLWMSLEGAAQPLSPSRPRALHLEEHFAARR